MPFRIRTLTVFVCLLFLSFASAKEINQNLLERENMYWDFRTQLATKAITSLSKINFFSPAVKEIFIDALWDALDEAQENNYPQFANYFSAISNGESLENWPLSSQLRLRFLQALHLHQKISRDFLLKMLVEIKNIRLTSQEATLLFSLISDPRDSLGMEKLKAPLYLAYPQEGVIFDQSISAAIPSEAEIRQIFNHLPDMTSYRQGEYQQVLRFYVFCRRNRDFPCLILMRNGQGELVLDEQGQIWHQPALAASSKGLPSHIRNGQTPTGVQTIDSVMPEANRQDAFGKFRRLILNWIPKVEDEELTNYLLPPESKTSDWWKGALVSRDAGRVDLRIHGTGRLNDDPSSTYYPHRKTSGCISQREGTYAEIEYVDQRKILDTSMQALGLGTSFENEVQIKGILYLIEINDQENAVSFDQLKSILDI